MLLSIPSPKLLFIVAALSFILTACASSYGSGTYGRHEVGQVNYVDYGEVIDVRNVRIASDEPGLGTIAGAVIGGAIGSEIGEGDAARVVGVVGGAIIGGAIGAAIEQDANTAGGYEYTIRMENGDTITIVQEADGPPIQSGTRVRIIEGDRLRVVPDSRY